MNSRRARLIRREVVELVGRFQKLGLEDDWRRMYRRAKKHYVRTGEMPLEAVEKRRRRV